MEDMQKKYDAKLKRVADAVKLVEPDRIPIVPVFQAFPVYYAQSKGIDVTIQDLMYEYRKCSQVYDCLYDDFDPDMGWDPILFYPTDYMERLGLTWFKWPGKKDKDLAPMDIDPNTMYQYIEDQYMKGDEYPEAIRDMTKFMMNKWYPRSFSKLSGLAKVDFRDSMWFGHMGQIAAFSDPEVQDSFKALFDAGQMLLNWFIYLGEYQAHMKEKYGMPPLYAGFAYAPFDMIGDNMRGTVDILYDMYDHEEELLQLIDVVTDFAIKDIIAGCSGNAVPYVWHWLHKGVDEFMTDDQFKTFYWPSLRKMLIAEAEAGLVPMIYVEGAYNSRLEYFLDLPKGSCIVNLEYTDMAKAKKIIGDHLCLMGNVPAVTLTYGSAQETDDYCKWLIDTCAPGGGFIMDSGTMIDDANPDNIRVMFESIDKYGSK